jgi:uncharacterized membrane protein
MNMPALLECVAMVATGLFAGAAVYISLVEHPARVSCGPAVAVTEFAPSYRRAAVMQASLAVVGAASAIARWAVGGSIWWVVGGVLIGAVIPYTLTVVRPINERLLAPSLDPGSSDVERLLRRWGHLHAFRSVAAVLAFLVFGVMLARW